jgi:hypothetical protein
VAGATTAASRDTIIIIIIDAVAGTRRREGVAQKRESPGLGSLQALYSVILLSSEQKGQVAGS